MTYNTAYVTSACTLACFQFWSLKENQNKNVLERKSKQKRLSKTTRYALTRPVWKSGSWYFLSFSCSLTIFRTYSAKLTNQICCLSNSIKQEKEIKNHLTIYVACIFELNRKLLTNTPKYFYLFHLYVFPFIFYKTPCELLLLKFKLLFC